MAEKKILTGSVKLIAAVQAIVLVVGGVVGGTVAWLIATPDPVVNTFTYGDIDITLTETDTKLYLGNDVTPFPLSSIGFTINIKLSSM